MWDLFGLAAPPAGLIHTYPAAWIIDLEVYDVTVSQSNCICMPCFSNMVLTQKSPRIKKKKQKDVLGLVSWIVISQVRITAALWRLNSNCTFKTASASITIFCQDAGLYFSSWTEELRTPRRTTRWFHHFEGFSILAVISSPLYTASGL